MRRLLIHVLHGGLVAVSWAAFAVGVVPMAVSVLAQEVADLLADRLKG